MFSVFPLYDGTFSVGLDKKFNPIKRDDPPAKGALKISLNPFLIKAEKGNYIIDPGIGSFGVDTSTASLKKHLAEHRLKASDITNVFASHLHYDHIGGLADKNGDKWQLTFPKAKIWVSKQGWQKVMDMETYYDEEKTEFIRFVDGNTDLHFLEDGISPCADVESKTIGGHTEFSQLLAFQKGNQKYLMAGDVLATQGEVNRKFAAKYDLEPKKSMQLRQEITKKAYEEDFTIMAYHEPFHPLLKLTDYSERSGYSITPVEANETA